MDPSINHKLGYGTTCDPFANAPLFSSFFQAFATYDRKKRVPRKAGESLCVIIIIIFLQGILEFGLMISYDKESAETT